MDSYPPTNDFEQLSVAEKIVRLQDAWDRIAETPESVEVTTAQKQALDARLSDLAKHPDAGTNWESIKRKLQKR